MAAPSSSTLYFGKREEIQSQTTQQPSSTITSSTSTPTTAPQKKRRNQPGNPNPDAEVVALSPKTLMATNRFICEVCNKGFQREQNLQLHRRGHNLPWKLKQKSKKEPKRKVYLCPEPTCVHHDPSRALGDLTGIKKHYSRKHGEKKWKCEKCSKRYAVQSDWKAHSKTCGTREYRCDCGTLFSRRDSFITHRAFCDALAQESARHPTSLNTMGSHHLFGNNHMSLGLSPVGSQNPPLHNPNHSSSNMLRLGSSGGAAKFEHLIPPSSPFGQPRQPMPPSSALFNMPDANQSFPNKHLHGLMQQLPDLQNSSNNSPQATNFFNLGFFSNNSSSMGGINGDHANLSSSGLLMQDQLNNGNGGGGGHGTALFSSGNMGHNGGSCVSSLYGSSMHPENIDSHMSATALLQKAAQIGSTSSSNNSSLLRNLVSSSSSTPTYDKQNALASFGINFGSGHGGTDHQNLRSHMENESHLQGLMNSLANAGSSIFVGGHGQDNNFGGFNGSHRNSSFSGVDEAKLHQNLAHVSFGGSDKLTLDFLGVGGMVRNLGGGYSQTDQQQQHAMNMSSLEPGLSTDQGSHEPFGSTTLQ